MEHLILFGPRDVQQRWRRHRDADGGELVCFFANDKLTFPEDITLREAIDHARRHLKDSPGIVMTVEIAGDRAHASLQRSGKHALLPSRVLVVGLDGVYEEREIVARETVFKLMRWQSLLVPAAAGLEKKMTAFVSTLEDLPPDYRAAMLFTLVVPTLESRIARLEQIEPLLKSLPPSDSAHARSHGPNRLAVVRDLLLLASVILLLVGLAVVSYSLGDVERALERNGQTIAAGFQALGVPPTALQPSEDPDVDSAGTSSAKPPAPGTETSYRAGSFEDKLSRFIESSEKESDPFPLDAVSFLGTEPRIDPAATEQLQFVGRIMKQNPQLTVEIRGYGDNQDSSDQKRTTSRARAQAIRTELVRLGAGASQITSVSDTTDEGRQVPRNRRVELRFVR